MVLSWSDSMTKRQRFEMLTEEECKKIAKKWFFQESVTLELQKQQVNEKEKNVKEEQHKLEKEKIELKQRIREFESFERLKKNQMEHEKNLFEMKWKLLEEEYIRLANDKLRFERERNFYRLVNDGIDSSGKVTAKMFFKGTHDPKSIKKRYRELIKIFHPDNMNGDNYTLQEINREYDQMMEGFQK